MKYIMYRIIQLNIIKKYSQIYVSYNLYFGSIISDDYFWNENPS